MTSRPKDDAGDRPDWRRQQEATAASGVSLDIGLVLCGLLTVPFVFSVEIEYERVRMMRATVPFIDAIIWSSALLVLACDRWSIFGDRPPHRPARRPTVPLLSVELLLFVAVAGLSLADSTLTAASVKEFVQLTGYYVIWYWLVARSARRQAFFDSAGFVLAGFLVVLVAVALAQMTWGTPVHLVRSIYRDRQSFLAAIVLLAPVVWSRLVSSTSRWVSLTGQIAMGIGAAQLCSLTTVTLLTIQLWMAARLMSVNWRQRGFIATAIILICLLGPTRSRSGLVRPIQDFGMVPLNETRVEVSEAQDLLHGPAPMMQLAWRGWNCLFGADANDWQRRFPSVQGAAEMTSSQLVLSEYLAESWSALELLRRGPFWGWGLGNWQHYIGTAYGVLERTGTAFPNTTNGYLFLVVTTGMFGLLAWGLALRKALLRSYRQTSSRFSPLKRATAAGCWSGLAGGAVYMLVCPIATQPLAAYWVFLAAWVHGMRERRWE